VGRIGSVERAAYLSAALTVLSVVPVVSTTYSEPFHVSSQLASIDHVTAGRSGWVGGHRHRSLQCGQRLGQAGGFWRGPTAP